jgi:ABC-type Mn2+/Zn2+ transport system permease subunit
MHNKVFNALNKWSNIYISTFNTATYATRLVTMQINEWCLMWCMVVVVVVVTMVVVVVMMVVALTVVPSHGSDCAPLTPPASTTSMHTQNRNTS